MAINNLNPRRTVWFSPHEPSNKYDIWLSKNAHYDENGDPTTDSNAQRDCDYIFKIYDCGKWNPIVGFNTTAANKINIVPNHGENHVPLFLNQSQSPDELFDAGTMTDVLTNVDYVDWETVLGDEDFQHAWDVTVNNLNVRRADHEILGGVWADTFNNIATNGFAQCKFKNNSDSNLYVSGDDILGAIGGSSTGTVDTDLLYRSFYNSPTILKGWQESLYSAQKPRFELSGSRVVENRGKIPMLRNDDWWETHGSGYTGDYNDDNSALIWVSPYELPLASTVALGGIRADTHAGLLQGRYVAECKLYNPIYLSLPDSYRREALCVDVRDVKEALDNWYASEDSTVWDLNIGSGYGINTIKLLTYNPNTEVTSNRYTHILDGYTSDTKQGLFCRTKYYENGNAFGNHYGLEWVDIQAGVGTNIEIDNGIMTVSADIENVELDNPPASLSITNSTVSGQEDSIIITGTNYEKVVGPYEVFDYQTYIDSYSFDFSQTQSFQNTNPIYIKIKAKLITIANGTKYICDSLVDKSIPGGEYLVTILFGVIKFEKINTFNNT